MVEQKVLFTEEEVHKIRGYVTKLEDRVVGTYHPDINDGKHDPKGGHNLAEHLPWSSSKKYNWINERILNWVTELNLPIVNLGWEFIVQKYPKGFEFKPHIDDVSTGKTKLDRKRYYTILIQLGSTDEYSGGELWVRDDKDILINQEIGNVSIFGNAKLHWVTPIESGERWSCTIFLEKDALKKYDLI
jgi:predicted 2-oxoglutarate/Fe(II)-dependent dioxygenase YbiX